VTNAELAILSLVVEQPRHGYDIEQTIVERNMRDWTDVGFSSIYYLLGKLEKAGQVESRRVPAPGSGPARRVYSATDTGVAAMQEQAIQALAGPARQHSSFQLGLAVLPMLDADQITAALAGHEADLEGQLEMLRGRRDEVLPFHVWAMFDLGIAQLEAELEWIRRFGADFSQHHPTERMKP
jgi:DNA-binding PadR family transcriptional regulator